MKMEKVASVAVKTASILLVDDSEVNLGVVVEGLESYGYDVLVALDGEEALLRVEVAMPDIILLDVMMPGIDGFEVCRRLKAQVHTRDIPVIFMTSMSGVQDKVEGFAAGGVDYITKPLQVDELRARIDTHLELRSLRLRLESKNSKLKQEIAEREQAEEALRKKVELISELNKNLETQTWALKESQERIRRTEAWYRGIVRSAPDGMMLVGEDGRISLVNEHLEKLFGYTESEMLGQPMEMLLPADVRGRHRDKRVRFFAERTAERPMAAMVNGLRACHKDGREFSVDVSLSHVVDADGETDVICAAVRDITERQRIERALAARENEYRTLVENSQDAIVRYDLQCRRVYANPVWAKVNGIPASDVIGKTPQELSVRIKPVAADFERRLREVITGKKQMELDLEWRNEAGELVCFAMNMIPEFDCSGQVISVLTVARDISERRRIEDALAVKEYESRTLIENSPDNISRYDRNCRRVYVNPAYGAMVDGGVEALLGRTPSEYPGGHNADLYEAKILTVFASGEAAEFELKWQDKLGKERCSHVMLAAERDKVGEIVSVLTVGRDITELNEHRKRIYQMAFYDTLTQLPNRALLNDRMRQMLSDSAWHDHLAGVMLLDLDRFKAVNDSMGHAAGDELLREAAMRLTYCVRGYDTVARLGGDEFAILLPEIRSGDDLGRIATKILESFNEPFMLEDKEVFISCSIGISVFPADGQDEGDLLKQADSAMYFAKRSGRNNFRFYSSGMTASAHERLMLEGDLRRGFARGELSLHFQPKVRLADEKVIGSEALLRWHHPVRGMIPPDKFISIAEDSGLIVEIGEWVLHEACRTACEWNADGESHKLAINLSARQFQSNALLKTVKKVLAETGCRPEWIELEITESLLLEEEGEILTTLGAFRDMGISIAIDDFGTGYSSLSYLAKFPIDTLKIDRSFTSRVTEKGLHTELVKAIISIAKCLGQQVVAEGAETAEEVALLREYGCHLVQGYFYGKPMCRQAYETYFSGI